MANETLQIAGSVTPFIGGMDEAVDVVDTQERFASASGMLPFFSGMQQRQFGKKLIDAYPSKEVLGIHQTFNGICQYGYYVQTNEKLYYHLCVAPSDMRINFATLQSFGVGENNVTLDIFGQNSNLGQLSKSVGSSCVFDFPDRPVRPVPPDDGTGHPPDDYPYDPVDDWHGPPPPPPPDDTGDVTDGPNKFLLNVEAIRTLIYGEAYPAGPEDWPLRKILLFWVNPDGFQIDDEPTFDIEYLASYIYRPVINISTAVRTKPPGSRFVIMLAYWSYSAAHQDGVFPRYDWQGNIMLYPLSLSLGGVVEGLSLTTTTVEDAGFSHMYIDSSGNVNDAAFALILLDLYSSIRTFNVVDTHTARGTIYAADSGYSI